MLFVLKMQIFTWVLIGLFMQKLYAYSGNSIFIKSGIRLIFSCIPCHLIYDSLVSVFIVMKLVDIMIKEFVNPINKHVPLTDAILILSRKCH